MNAIAPTLDRSRAQRLGCAVDRIVVAAATAKVAHDHPRPWRYVARGASYRVEDSAGALVLMTLNPAVAHLLADPA